MTIEYTDRELAMSLLSDIHKDAYGYRPRGSYREDLTIEQINEEIERLHVISLANMEEEELQDKACAEDFRALVVKTIVLGASDEKTALKWLFDAFIDERGITQVGYFDIEQFVWGYGLLSTDYGDRVINIIKKPYIN